MRIIIIFLPPEEKLASKKMLLICPDSSVANEVYRNYITEFQIIYSRQTEFRELVKVVYDEVPDVIVFHIRSKIEKEEVFLKLRNVFRQHYRVVGIVNDGSMIEKNDPSIFLVNDLAEALSLQG